MFIDAEVTIGYLLLKSFLLFFFPKIYQEYLINHLEYSGISQEILINPHVLRNSRCVNDTWELCCKRLD